MRVRKTAVFGAVAVLAFATATVRTAAQGPFASIVAFGASLSDSGNAFALRGGTNTPPDYLLDPLLVPSAPYARGGHHFSNGATWIEQFARSQGLAGSVRPAYQEFRQWNELRGGCGASVRGRPERQSVGAGRRVSRRRWRRCPVRCPVYDRNGRQ